VERAGRALFAGGGQARGNRAQGVVFDNQLGGTIRVDNSYGYLTVEGWDEPEVEVTVTKSTDRFYDPKQRDEVAPRFERIRVIAERQSDKESAISTTLPARHGLPYSILPSRQIVFTMPKKTALGVTLDYTLHVPRDSRLIVHHDHGYVWVSDVTGDIEVNSHTGDMVVVLPDPGPYAIDARTRLGSVSSDLAGEGHKQFLVGTQFVRACEAPSRKIYLRMGRGNITIKNGPPSGPFRNN
jgi:hypothetical protein